MAKLAVETKFARFAVLICPAKLAVETMFAKLAVETKFARFAVLTCPAKLAVETRLARFAVLTNPPKLGILERYPAVPRPITVEVTFVAKPILETKPAVPRPITVLVNSVGSIKLLIYWVNPIDVDKSCELLT